MMKTGFIFLPMLQGNRLFKGLPKEIVLQSKSDLCLLYAVVRKCTHYKVTRIIGRKLQRCSENSLLSLRRHQRKLRYWTVFVVWNGDIEKNCQFFTNFAQNNDEHIFGRSRKITWQNAIFLVCDVRNFWKGYKLLSKGNYK